MRETNRRFTQRRVVATLGALTLGLIGVGGAVSPATAADTPVFGDINQSTIGSIVVHKVREATGAFGYNAATGVYEDLVQAGVIDPAKVVRVALQNAASVASLMLTTEAAIATLPAPADRVAAE